MYHSQHTFGNKHLENLFSFDRRQGEEKGEVEDGEAASVKLNTSKILKIILKHLHGHAQRLSHFEKQLCML